MIGREKLTENEKIMLHYSNVGYAYDEAVKYYELVKSMKKADFNKLPLEEKREVATLKLLSKLGFSLDELGTYLYARAICQMSMKIKEIFNPMANITSQDLILELTEPYSSLYHYIAREELEIGVNKYHAYIEKTIANLDSKRVDSRVVKKIYKDDLESLDYGMNAFVLAGYLAGIRNDVNSKRNKPPQITPLKGELKRDVLNEFLKRF